MSRRYSPAVADLRDRVYNGEVFARHSVVTAPEGGTCGLEVSPGVGTILVRSRT